MANREQPYDPYIPAGGASHAGNTAQDGGNQRTAALQAVCHALPSTPFMKAHKPFTHFLHKPHAQSITTSVSLPRDLVHLSQPHKQLTLFLSR